MRHHSRTGPAIGKQSVLFPSFLPLARLRRANSPFFFVYGVRLRRTNFTLGPSGQDVHVGVGWPMYYPFIDSSI